MRSPERPARSSRVGLSQILVVAQIAFALVLVVAAGLFGRTLSNLHAIELGFNREDVLLFTIRPGAVGYQNPALKRLYTDLRERLSQVPGVRSVSLSSRSLPAGGGTMAPVTAVGVPPPLAAPGQRPPNLAGVFTVGPAFFATMQIPLIAGREFDERDGEGAPPVAVINQRLAKILGLDNPVGSRIGLGAPTVRSRRRGRGSALSVPQGRATPDGVLPVSPGSVSARAPERLPR